MSSYKAAWVPETKNSLSMPKSIAGDKNGCEGALCLKVWLEFGYRKDRGAGGARRHLSDGNVRGFVVEARGLQSHKRSRLYAETKERAE